MVTENRDAQAFLGGLSIMNQANSMIGAGFAPGWTVTLTGSANRVTTINDGHDARKLATLIYDLQNLGVLPRA